MKTRKIFSSVRGSSIRELQGRMSLFGVFTLLSLGVLAGGCGGSGGGWYQASPQCSNAVAGANEPGGDFTGCVLNNATLNSTNFSLADFDGAELNGTKFYIPLSYGAQLVETKFTNVSANSVDFTMADLTEADFRPDIPYGTDLQWAVFDGATLNKARMDGEVDLRDASFVGAYLDCANLRNADLRNVDFTGASLLNADFTDALLTGANFDGAAVDGACFDGAIGVVFSPPSASNPTTGTVSSTGPNTCVPFP